MSLSTPVTFFDCFPTRYREGFLLPCPYYRGLPKPSLNVVLGRAITHRPRYIDGPRARLPAGGVSATCSPVPTSTT